jgi:hypothetical protein
LIGGQLKSPYECCLRKLSVEKREVGLKKMLATVMKDKEKIEETIEELDRYKRDALQKTWEKVNGFDFLVRFLAILCSAMLFQGLWRHLC